MAFLGFRKRIDESCLREKEVFQLLSKKRQFSKPFHDPHDQSVGLTSDLLPC